MSLKRTLLTTSALTVFAGAAHADVSAQDIWNDWKSYWSGFGYQVDATEAMNGDNIAVSDLKMLFPLPQGEGEFSLSVSSINFIQNSDGTVGVVFPETIPISMKVAPENDVSVQAAIDYKMQNFAMTASGDPSKITYDYSADQLAILLKDLVIDGESIGGNMLKVQATMSDLTGQSVMDKKELRALNQTMKLGETVYSVSFADPSTSDTFMADGTIEAMTFDGASSIPKTLDPNDLPSALAAGFAIDGGFSYTGSSGKITMNDDTGTTTVNTNTDSAALNFAMNKEALTYSGANKGTSADMVGGGIPFPVSAQLGETAFNLLIPVSKDEAEPSDFAFGLTLRDFVTSEMIWSLIDPGAQLPHDPATVSIDLTGKAKMLLDLFDQEQMAAVEQGDAMPAELNAVTLNKLLVSVAGAKLTGDGDFTFDNTDLESFDGLPKPTGAVNLELLGGNGLMDKLVAMGLLPEEQAMGARMMMGLFARPGEGDDSLTSTLEINEEGHILANGQRIQ